MKHQNCDLSLEKWSIILNFAKYRREIVIIFTIL